MVDLSREDISNDMFEILELITFTLSNEFVEKWRFKYSERFVKAFQDKLLESFKKGKVLKRKVLENYLRTKYSYDLVQIKDFFNSIDIEIYYPIIN